MSSDLKPAPTTLKTDDGLTLEAEWVVPDRPRARVVIAHPHPQHGGNMQSLVVSTLFKHLTGPGGRSGLNHQGEVEGQAEPKDHVGGCAVLRFNFRGVGNSEGEHDFGEGEQLDVRAAVAAMAGLDHDGGSLILAGWSFGADLSLTCDAPELAGWFLVAPPLRMLDSGRFRAAHDPRPKWLAVPERDQFNPPDQARSATAGWLNAEVHPVGGADHFLVGRTAKLNDLLDEFLARF